MSYHFSRQVKQPIRMPKGRMATTEVWRDKGTSDEVTLALAKRTVARNTKHMPHPDEQRRAQYQNSSYHIKYPEPTKPSHTSPPIEQVFSSYVDSLHSLKSVTSASNSARAPSAIKPNTASNNHSHRVLIQPSKGQLHPTSASHRPHTTGHTGHTPRALFQHVESRREPQRLATNFLQRLYHLHSHLDSVTARPPATPLVRASNS